MNIRFVSGVRLLILLTGLTYSMITYPQDTVFLLNGTIVTGKLTSEEGDFCRFQVQKKKNFKLVAIDKMDVFSLLVQGQEEKVIYKPDPVTGNDFSVSQMRDFWHGENQARNSYRPVLPVAGGVLAGAMSPAAGFWGLALAPVYLGAVSVRRPELPADMTIPSGIKDTEFYVMGYRYTARKIKVQRSAVAALSGLVTVWLIKVVADGIH